MYTKVSEASTAFGELRSYLFSVVNRGVDKGGHDLPQRPAGDISSFVFWSVTDRLMLSEPFKVPGETPPVPKPHAIRDQETLWFDNVL